MHAASANTPSFSSEPDNGDKNNCLFLEVNFGRLVITESEKERIRKHLTQNVEIKPSDAGVPNMVLDGVSIYDEENPIAKAKLQVDLIEGDDKADVVVLFGFGLGYHAEHIERRFSCPQIVYDPSLDALTATLHRRMLNLKNTVVVTDIPHLIAETQPRLQFNDRKIVVAAIPAYRQLFPDGFKEFVSALQTASENAKILENTTVVRSPNWIYHAVKNVPKAADKSSVDILSNKFVGKPGILVAAGPSLESNIAQLKKAMGHAVIIAVNAAAAPLACAGVKPDLIAVVEGLDLRAQLKDLPWLNDVALVPSLNCFPGFFDLDARRIFPLVDSAITCSDWFSRAYHWRRFPSGGSVACSAFSLLHAFGCDPIILVGQDLAYTEGKSYAATATFGKQTMRYDGKTNRLVAVEEERNNDIESIRTGGGLSPINNLNALETEAFGGNGTVYTVGIFNLFRSWFETAAASWAEDRTLINATEGGARIHHFQEMSLSKALSLHCTSKVAATAIIEEAANTAPKNDIAALSHTISADVQTIDAILAMTDKTKKEAEAAIQELETGDLVTADPSLRRLSQLETELRALTKKNHIVDAFVSGKVQRIRSERFKDNDPDINQQTTNSLHRTISLLDLIRDGGMELKCLFEPLVSLLKQMES